MATKDEYAKWCMQLIEGDDHVFNDIMAALYEDGYIDESDDWIDDEDE